MTYSNLTKSGERHIQHGAKLLGMCCVGDKLYCVQKEESHRHNADLCLYQVAADRLTLLDRAEVYGPGEYPRYCQPDVDRQTHHIYVPSY